MLFVRLLVISLAAYFLAVSATIVCMWMFTEQLQLSAEAKDVECMLEYDILQ